MNALLNQSAFNSVVLMHDGIKEFALSIGTLPINTMFQEIVTRMPLLTHLDLRLHVPMHSVELEALELFRGLRKLQVVILPNYHLTANVIQELSRLPDLGVVQFEYGGTQGFGDPSDVHVFDPRLEDGAFPALWDLSLTARLIDMDCFMNAPFAPINITSLYIDSSFTVPETSESVHTFLCTVARTCKMLECLYLALITVTSEVQEGDIINFDTLRPLLDCPRLVTFELCHDHSLDITLENIEELTIKWPSIRSLLLNCEPRCLSQSSLTLRALVPFTRCHELRHLGLYLNATAADLPTKQEEFEPFQKLSKLSVGASEISEERSVALFLSRLCPMGCEIECGVTWHDRLIWEQELGDEISRRCNKWEKVGELLPLLWQLRQEEKIASKNLKAEVEDLRMRTRVLMDREKLATPAGCVVL